MARRESLLLAALSVCLLTGSMPGSAKACALSLVVAMDGSSSVDETEHRQQLAGLSQALADAEVGAAIKQIGGIWFSSFEWSGRRQQAIQVPWLFLAGPEEARAAGARLLATRRAFNEFPTALGYALGFAAVHLRKVPDPCLRQVIDVAGDGITNDGFEPPSAYRAFHQDFDRITVNGLAISGADPDPVTYYREVLLHGPGAFVEVADGFDDYARAMKKKLLREILTSFTATAPSRNNRMALNIGPGSLLPPPDKTP